MNYIVAVDNKWNIGKSNDLLFNIHADMMYFKEHTLNKTVIMGDRTLLSLPGGKPLKNRQNVVLSLDKDFNPDGTVTCHSLKELASFLETLPSTDDVFVIGGATIYNLLEPYCEYAYITKVDALRDDADVSITDIDAKDNWHMESFTPPQTENNLSFTFTVYKNSNPKPLCEME